MLFTPCIQTYVRSPSKFSPIRQVAQEPRHGSRTVRNNSRRVAQKSHQRVIDVIIWWWSHWFAHGLRATGMVGGTEAIFNTSRSILEYNIFVFIWPGFPIMAFIDFPNYFSDSHLHLRVMSVSHALGSLIPKYPLFSLLLRLHIAGSCISHFACLQVVLRVSFKP
jgi:hypothetical protein